MIGRQWRALPAADQPGNRFRHETLALQAGFPAVALHAKERGKRSGRVAVNAARRLAAQSRKPRVPNYRFALLIRSGSV
jgi:hypothetical protein